MKKYCARQTGQAWSAHEQGESGIEGSKLKLEVWKMGRLLSKEIQEEWTEEQLPYCNIFNLWPP